MNAVLAGWCGPGIGRLVAGLALVLLLGACAIASPGAQATADRPGGDDGRFSRAEADAARAQMADASRAGLRTDALMAAALAVDRRGRGRRLWTPDAC